MVYTAFQVQIATFLAAPLSVDVCRNLLRSFSLLSESSLVCLVIVPHVLDFVSRSFLRANG